MIRVTVGRRKIFVWYEKALGEQLSLTKSFMNTFYIPFQKIMESCFRRKYFCIFLIRRYWMGIPGQCYTRIWVTYMDQEDPLYREYQKGDPAASVQNRS